jgi:hypothetical protein
VARAAPSLVVGGSDDEPLVLSGPPAELTGRIQLHNPGDAKVVLRDAGLKDPSGVLRLPETRHVLKPLVLRPDQGGSLELSVGVDPATPPGEYRAELDVGGRSQEVLLHVAEVVELSVEPRKLVLVNRPGVAQKKSLVVTNEGNVPFTLGDPAVVDLREDPQRNRALRVAIEPLLRRDNPDLEELVVALLAVAREEERLGSVDVRAAGRVEVQPGETTAVELELTLQERKQDEDELPATRRYRGKLPIVTRDVDVIVLASPGGPDTKPDKEEKPPTPRKRAASSAARRPPPKRGANR